jgi:hypothetical protein
MRQPVDTHHGLLATPEMVAVSICAYKSNDVECESAKSDHVIVLLHLMLGLPTVQNGFSASHPQRFLFPQVPVQRHAISFEE